MGSFDVFMNQYLKIGSDAFCHYVIIPCNTSFDLQVLMFLGPQALRKVIEDAELYPIRGLFAFKDFFAEIDNYYLGISGDELGIRTGWKSMDDLYKVTFTPRLDIGIEAQNSELLLDASNICCLDELGIDIGNLLQY